MIPQTTENSVAQNYEYRQPNLTYKVNEDNIIGKVTDLQAIEQSINHILNTERYAYPIYSDDYGIELEKYIGKDFAYLQADISDNIKNALLQDDRITDVQINNVYESTEQKNACVIEFTVYTIYGNLEEKLNVVQ